MKNDNPTISVVLPVHNGERFLAEALDSIFKQTFKNFEVLVINDASTDGTDDILAIYESRFENLRVLKIEKQKSLADVLNIGLAESKGKYIARMDADDIMLAQRFEKQVRFLDANPDVVVVGGQIDVIDEHGKVTSQRRYPFIDDELKRNLFVFSPFAHPAVMMRRNVVVEVGGYPAGKKAEDLYLWYLLARKGKFANLPDKIFQYRVVHGSIVHNDIWKFYQYTLESRKWAVEELGYKVDLRARVLGILETVGVRIFSLFPRKFLLFVYENARKVIFRKR